MPLVAIVGRPNVGKSTFFNRLTESRQSIVHDEPGVTRDRIYGRAEWNGRVFDVVDTGGYVPRSAERFDAAIREQVDIALQEADAVIFVADVLTGVTDLDGEIGKMLLRADTPVFVAVNKSDTPERRWDASEFWTLGIDHVFPISSITGSGTGDLLDAVVDALPEEDEEEDDEAVRIAVIGRPNVGKSSLVNALLGYERNIVTEISGTTRDATDARLAYEGQEIVLVDTAGLRKKSRVRENVEFYSTLRTERALRDGDVCVLVLDATLGIEKQDVHVLFEAAKFKKGLVVVLNKWDLIEDKDTFTARDYERQIRAALAPIDYVPLITISALTQQRIQRIIPTALEVAERRKQRIPTSKLNDLLQQAVQRAHPPTYRGAYVQIKFAQQVREEPPVIAFFCNHPEGVKENYKRYLENQLREAFDFEGVPLTLAFKKK